MYQAIYVLFLALSRNLYLCWARTPSAILMFHWFQKTQNANIISRIIRLNYRNFP